MAGSKKSQKKETKKKSKKIKAPELCSAYIQVNFNNTIITITEPNGRVLARSSAGACGFRGTRKSTPYASQVAAETAAKRVQSMGMKSLNVFVKGLGVGREQALRGIQVGGEIELLSIYDRTPEAHGGCRKPKPRKV